MQRFVGVGGWIIHQNTSEAAAKLAAKGVLRQRNNYLSGDVDVARCSVLVHDSSEALREFGGVAVMRFGDDIAGSIDEP